MKRLLLALVLMGASMATTDRAEAQMPGESVIYETVSPGTRTVTYGERYVVRRKPFKTVIRERPTRFVTTTPPLVRETRVLRPAPMIEQQVLLPPPVIQGRVIQADPVVQTRYLSPYRYPY